MTATPPEEFLDRCRPIVGSEHVFSPGEPGLDELRDRFGAFYETPDESRPGGAVRPGGLDELRAVVRLADEMRVPLWTSSRGRNYGYGGPAPVRSGDIALDLRRMDRVLEIDEERAFAVVEPGVTTGALLEEVERRGLRLWPDGVSSPYASIIGNALERGIGYGPMSERFEALCGLEVLLADGTLLRTGTGSMPGATTWNETKYGFGPALDGLFSQSNYGIVTKAGIWLNPEPEAFRHAELYLEDLSELEPFIDVLGRLRRSRVFDTGANSGPGVPPGQLRARIGFHGTPDMVEAKWRATRDAFAGLRSLRVETGYFEAPYDYAEWNAHARLAAGLPTPLEEPDWENAHYGVFAGIVLPNTGRAYVEAYEMLQAVYAEHGRVLPFPPGFHMHSPRALVILPPVELRGNPMLPDRGASIDNRVSVELVSAIQVEAARRGWSEYRAGTLFMDEVLAQQSFEGGSKAAVYERLKSALDPNGILSPGKSGIWGAARKTAE